MPLPVVSAINFHLHAFSPPSIPHERCCGETIQKHALVPFLNGDSRNSNQIAPISITKTSAHASSSPGLRRPSANLGTDKYIGQSSGCFYATLLSLCTRSPTNCVKLHLTFPWPMATAHSLQVLSHFSAACRSREDVLRIGAVLCGWPYDLVVIFPAVSSPRSNT